MPTRHPRVLSDDRDCDWLRVIDASDLSDNERAEVEARVRDIYWPIGRPRRPGSPPLPLVRELIEALRAERPRERDLAMLTVGEVASYLTDLAAGGCTGVVAPLQDGSIVVTHHEDDQEPCPVHEG